MVEVSWPGLEEEGAGRLGVGEGSHLSACEGHTFLWARGGVSCVFQAEMAGVCLLGLSPGLSTGSPSTHTPPPSVSVGACFLGSGLHGGGSEGSLGDHRLGGVYAWVCGRSHYPLCVDPMVSFCIRRAPRWVGFWGLPS